MGRSMPVECHHGVVVDWGDFGDGGNECERCEAERRGFAMGVWQAQLEAVTRTLHANRYRLARGVLAGPDWLAMFENVAREALIAAGITPPKEAS